MSMFLFMLLSCLKNPVIDHAGAREVLKGKDCLEEIKVLLQEQDCPELEYRWRSEFDIMFRCHKNNDARTNFWDTYIFRMSPSNLIFYGDRQAFIKKHTICDDNIIRITAYHPSLWDTL